MRLSKVERVSRNGRRLAVGAILVACGWSAGLVAGQLTPAAPHAQAIQESLQTASGQIRELRAEVQKAQPGNSAQEHQIDKLAHAASASLGSALTEQDRLEHLSNSDLSIRDNPEYRGLHGALSRIAIDHQNLDLKINERKLTQDKSQSLKDLSRIQSDLALGIRHAQGLAGQAQG